MPHLEQVSANLWSQRAQTGLFFALLAGVTSIFVQPKGTIYFVPPCLSTLLQASSFNPRVCHQSGVPSITATHGSWYRYSMPGELRVNFLGFIYDPSSVSSDECG